MTTVDVQPPSIWGGFAVCAETLDELFFPVEDHKILPEHAKAIATIYCNRCPVIRQCRQFALACDPDPGGIWGGTTPRERNKLRKTFETQDIYFTTNLELDPEQFAPEPRSHLIQRLVSEDRETLLAAERYLVKVREQAGKAREDYPQVPVVEESPAPILVTVSTSQVEWSLAVIPATVQPEAFPDPMQDLEGALRYLGIQ